MGADVNYRWSFFKMLGRALSSTAHREEEKARKLRNLARHATQCGYCAPNYICPSFQIELQDAIEDPDMPFTRKLRRRVKKWLSDNAVYKYRDPKNAHVNFNGREPEEERAIRKNALHAEQQQDCCKRCCCK